MVRIRSEIEKNTLFGRALVRVRAKIEKNTLFGRDLIRVRAKQRKKPFLVGLYLGLGKKRVKHILWKGFG